jgi:hypothetical protein
MFYFINRAKRNIRIWYNLGLLGTPTHVFNAKDDKIWERELNIQELNLNKMSPIQYRAH